MAEEDGEGNEVVGDVISMEMGGRAVSALPQTHLTAPSLITHTSHSFLNLFTGGLYKHATTYIT